jgi:hypothetical protein
MKILYKKCDVLKKIICIFSNILQKISSQKSFLRKSENDHKKDYNPWVFCHRWLIWLWSHPICVYKGYHPYNVLGELKACHPNCHTHIFARQPSIYIGGYRGQQFRSFSIPSPL